MTPATDHQSERTRSFQLAGWALLALSILGLAGLVWRWQLGRQTRQALEEAQAVGAEFRPEQSAQAIAARSESDSSSALLLYRQALETLDAVWQEEDLDREGRYSPAREMFDQPYQSVRWRGRIQVAMDVLAEIDSLDQETPKSEAALKEWLAELNRGGNPSSEMVAFLDNRKPVYALVDKAAAQAPGGWQKVDPEGLFPGRLYTFDDVILLDALVALRQNKINRFLDRLESLIHLARSLETVPVLSFSFVYETLTSRVKICRLVESAAPQLQEALAEEIISADRIERIGRWLAQTEEIQQSYYQCRLRIWVYYKKKIDNFQQEQRNRYDPIRWWSLQLTSMPMLRQDLARLLRRKGIRIKVAAAEDFPQAQKLLGEIPTPWDLTYHPGRFISNDALERDKVEWIYQTMTLQKLAATRVGMVLLQEQLEGPADLARAAARVGTDLSDPMTRDGKIRLGRVEKTGALVLLTAHANDAEDAVFQYRSLGGDVFAGILWIDPSLAPEPEPEPDYR